MDETKERKEGREGQVSMSDQTPRFNERPATSIAGLFPLGEPLIDPFLTPMLPWTHASTSDSPSTQSTDPRNQSLSPPARPQSGRLVPLGTGGAPRSLNEETHSLVHRLFRLPLVPRDGAGVVRK